MPSLSVALQQQLPARIMQLLRPRHLSQPYSRALVLFVMITASHEQIGMQAPAVALLVMTMITASQSLEIVHEVTLQLAIESAAGRVDELAIDHAIECMHVLAIAAVAISRAQDF